MEKTYLPVPGVQITIKGSRFSGDDDSNAPYGLKYSPGNATIMSVYRSLDEIPAERLSELKNYMGESAYSDYIIGLHFTDTPKYYFDVKSGLSDKYIIPSSDVEGTPIEKTKKDLKEDVEKYLADKEKNKEFKDTGTRASGTSKEKSAWSKVMITAGDVDALEKNRGLTDLIKKDKVFPKVDPQEEKDNGVSSPCAFMKSKIREFYPPKPKVENTLGRRSYIEGAERLVSAYSQVNELSDLNENVIGNSEILMEAVIESSPDPEKLRDEIALFERLQGEFESSLKNAKNEAVEFNEAMLQKYGIVPRSYEGLKAVLNDELMDGKEVEKAENINGALNEFTSKYRNMLSMTDFFILQFPNVTLLINDSKSGLRYWRSAPDIMSHVIYAIFEKRFLSFFFKEDKFAEILKKAYAYGKFTQEDFNRLAQPEIDKINVSIEKQREFIKKISSDLSYEEMREILSQSYTGYYEGLFHPSLRVDLIPKKFKGDKKVHIYGSTILSLDPVSYPKWEELAKAYLEMRKSRVEDSIKMSQKKIDEITAQYPINEKGDDWSWTEKKISEGETKENRNREATTAIKLTYIKRTGGYDTSMVDNAEQARRFIIDIFGFGGFTGGSTLRDEDARNHIRYFTGAMSDLGEILNLDIKELNRRGNLLYALGSFAGQRSLAFFRHSNGENLISFTKTRGDGTVCHEYGHYMDFLMGGFRKFASSVDLSKYMEYGISKTMALVRKLMDYIINYGGLQRRDKILVTVPVKYKDWSLAPDLRRIFESAKDVDSAIEMLQERFSRYRSYSKLKPNDLAVIYTIISHYGHKEHEVSFLIRGSRFYTASVSMDSTRSKKYWSEPQELFARAFETYVYDKLEKAGRANNYLVAGNFALYPDDIYPSGQERETIFTIFEEIMDAFREDYSIPGFTHTWTDVRTDEYADLEDEQEVTVDAGTGELLNTNTGVENITKTLRQVNRILSKNSKEDGTEV